MRSIARTYAAAFMVLLGAAASQALEAKLPPVVAPVELAPEDVEPTLITLLGKATLRAGGQREAGRYVAQLAYDLDAKTFTLIPLVGTDVFVNGRLAPKGKSGRKFTLFLDDVSHDAFTDVLAKLAQVFLTDADPKEILGDSTDLVMTLDANGVPSLRIKSRVLTEGLGEVVFKANVTQDELPQ